MRKVQIREMLSKDKDLEIWIRTLLTVYPTIPNIEKVISSIIESKACSLTSFYASNGMAKCSSFDQVSKVMKILERKEKLIDVYHMIRELIEPISKEDMKFVEMRFFRRMRPDKIAALMDVSLRTVYRHTTRIIEKIAVSCLERGITSTYLKSKTKSEPWIYAQFEKIASDLAVNVKRGGGEIEEDNAPESAL